MIDEDRPRLHAGKRPRFSKHDASQIVVVAHTGEDDTCAAGRFSRRHRHAASEHLNPLLSLGRRTVVDTDVMSGKLQMPRHRKSHDAQADKRHLERGNARISLVHLHNRLLLQQTQNAQASPARSPHS